MALVVVSDSSPIRALHHLDLLHLCAILYGTVIVPAAVEEELSHPTMTCKSLEIGHYAGFEVRSPRSQGGALGVPSDLDRGETEAITLAIELQADLMLIEERKGTEAARHLGLTTIGVFGLLLEAKRKGHISKVLPCFDRLAAELRFFVARSLRERLAQLAGE